MLLQWTQTLPLLVLSQKTHSGINNLISDKIEYSEGDCHLLTLILLTIVVYMWLPWKQWTFRMVFLQPPLMISKITKCWCLTWLQWKTPLKTVTILNLLENHWDWSYILPTFFKSLLKSLYWVNECRRLQLTSLVLLQRMCKNE